jgi:hypothetical protein
MFNYSKYHSNRKESFSYYKVCMHIYIVFVTHETRQLYCKFEIKCLYYFTIPYLHTYVCCYLREYNSKCRIGYAAAYFKWLLGCTICVGILCLFARLTRNAIIFSRKAMLVRPYNSGRIIAERDSLSTLVQSQTTVLRLHLGLTTVLRQFCRLLRRNRQKRRHSNTSSRCR